MLKIKGIFPLINPRACKGYSIRTLELLNKMMIISFLQLNLSCMKFRRSLSPQSTTNFNVVYLNLSQNLILKFVGVSYLSSATVWSVFLQLFAKDLHVGWGQMITRVQNGVARVQFLWRMSVYSMERIKRNIVLLAINTLLCLCLYL
jgi:hypothetical protein